MEPTSLCICVLILTVVIYLWSRVRGSSHQQGKPLPGPGLLEGLRVFIKGSLNNTLHLYLPEWAAKYGYIMQVNLLLRKVVFVNTADIFRRLVKSHEFRDFTNDRPPTYFASQFIPGLKDVAACNYDAAFQERRRIFHSTLRFYGEGREYIEDTLLSGLTDLASTLDTSQPVELSTELRNLVAKIVCFLMTGDPSDATKENVDLIKNYTDGVDRLFVIENETFLQPFPWLRFIPGLRFKKLHDDLETSLKDLRNFYFYSLRNRFNSGCTKGVICELFALEKASKEDGSNVVDDDTIKGFLHDFIAAGYLTTSATLHCLFLHLVKHREVQDRIYQEIREVVGGSTPSFSHNSKMPYTEAVLLETLRISTILPLLVPHLFNKDIVFDGYFIPKSSMLSMNSWYHHHDEKLWDDPFAFKPDKFLDPNGELLSVNHPIRQQLIAFGTGPRMCPGETFAKSRAFLVTIFLLKHFEFVSDENGPSLPSTDPREWEGSGILSPANFTCKARRRTNVSGSHDNRSSLEQ